MASFSILNFTFVTALLISLSLSIPLPNMPQFDRNLLVIGDARPILNSSPSSVQLTDPNSSSSSGLLIHSKPFKFRTSKYPVSFSTDFVFSISPHDGDGLALILVPTTTTDFASRFSRDGFGVSQEKRFLAVVFDTLKNANRVGVDVDSLDSVKMSNVSSINLVLNSGVKLHSWVDYDLSSKRLEVRLSEFGRPRPYDPLLARGIDLGEMWKGEEVLFGLSSSGGNSMQKTYIYSWKFITRIFPKWIHSQPVNPQAFLTERPEDEVADKKRRLCALRLISGLIFAVAYGLLAAFGVLILWALLANNNSNNPVKMIPIKCSANPEDIRYEKINVVLDASSESDDVKN